MANFEARSYTISDFVEWHETDKLELSPDFQRRGVWSSTAKSFLIDTILRGKPFPKLIIMQDFRDNRSIRVVVDGQQRLRAIIDFFRNDVRISRAHSQDYAGRTFATLGKPAQNEFLQYPISVDVLFSAPRSELLDIFARINRYTVKLNKQELLNAQYSGYFKSAAFELGYQYVEYWLAARVLTPSRVNRMAEAELASDLLATLCNGIQSNRNVEGLYREYEDIEGPVFEKADLFNTVMSYIGEMYTAEDIRQTCWNRQHMFYTLFTVVAHLLQPFERLDRPLAPEEMLTSLNKCRVVLDDISIDFMRYKDVNIDADPPERLREFLRASTKATTDTGSRRIRCNYCIQQLNIAFL